MFDEFLVRFKSTVYLQDIEAFSSRHGVEVVEISNVEPTQYTFRWTPAADGNPLVMANMFFDSLDCEWAHWSTDILPKARLSRVNLCAIRHGLP